MSFEHEHEQSSAMLNKLYGDAGASISRAPLKDKTQYGVTWATKTFYKHIKDRLELRSSFCAYLFF